jgi:hypothetical protein
MSAMYADSTDAFLQRHAGMPNAAGALLSASAKP